MIPPDSLRLAFFDGGDFDALVSRIIGQLDGDQLDGEEEDDERPSATFQLSGDGRDAEVTLVAGAQGVCVADVSGSTAVDTAFQIAERLHLVPAPLVHLHARSSQANREVRLDALDTLTSLYMDPVHGVFWDDEARRSVEAAVAAGDVDLTVSGAMLALLSEPPPDGRARVQALVDDPTHGAARDVLTAILEDTWVEEGDEEGLIDNWTELLDPPASDEEVVLPILAPEVAERVVEVILAVPGVEIVERTDRPHVIGAQLRLDAIAIEALVDRRFGVGMVSVSGPDTADLAWTLTRRLPVLPVLLLKLTAVHARDSVHRLRAVMGLGLMHWRPPQTYVDPQVLQILQAATMDPAPEVSALAVSLIAQAEELSRS